MVRKLPAKKEILEHAKRIELSDIVSSGLPALTPEEEELKESGAFQRARIDLMRSEETKIEMQQRKYLDQMAGEMGLRVVSRSEIKEIEKAAREKALQRRKKALFDRPREQRLRVLKRLMEGLQAEDEAVVYGRLAPRARTAEVVPFGSAGVKELQDLMGDLIRRGDVIAIKPDYIYKLTEPKKKPLRKPKVEPKRKLVRRKRPEKIRVRFKQEIPAIVGADMRVYGEFQKGDVTELPSINAQILIKQGVASKTKRKITTRKKPRPVTIPKPKIPKVEITATELISTGVHKPILMKSVSKGKTVKKPPWFGVVIGETLKTDFGAKERRKAISMAKKDAKRKTQTERVINS